VIVPRRSRADWRQEWEAELRYREALLARAAARRKEIAAVSEQACLGLFVRSKLRQTKAAASCCTPKCVTVIAKCGTSTTPVISNRYTAWN
jgi:hypothetical protein